MAPVTLGKINVDIFKSFEQEFNYLQCLIQGNEILRKEIQK